ncbi:hypothetical protein JXA48_05225 [Candidatus Woesearchaeota archaeon]|nr:hypothetical protein [Candidatus Woesearchaeota archaeon]
MIKILTYEDELEKELSKPDYLEVEVSPIVSLQKLEDAHLFPRDQELYRNEDLSELFFLVF